MLPITEKDIENRKNSIEASLNYYSRQMDRKDVHKELKESFGRSCSSLIRALDKTKVSLLHLYLMDMEKHSEFIKMTKERIEKVFNETRVQQNFLLEEAREVLKSAS